MRQLFGNRRRKRSRGQSLLEFALVTPLMLLIFAGAVDFGRAFYAFVALENAVKEGALYGARNPICTNISVECPDAKTVLYRVANEAPDDTTVVASAECVDVLTGVTYADLKLCEAGDTYVVRAQYTFDMVTPLLDAVIGGSMTLTSESSATVLNRAFDPTPGLGPLKLINAQGANAPRNAAEIIANCEEPFPGVYDGYYPSPCKDAVDPIDADVYATYYAGDSIAYKITVRNNGGSTVNGITATDSLGWTCPAVPTQMTVLAAVYECNYTRTAPTPGGSTMEYGNVLTVDGDEIQPAVAEAIVKVELPPPDLNVFKYVSVYEKGADGDGMIGSAITFGTAKSATVRYNATTPNPYAWYKVVVTNTGGQTATGVSIADDQVPIPFGQNNANAICDAAPGSIGVGGRWECRYKVTYSFDRTVVNTVAATADNVTPDSGDDSAATVTAQSCSASNRVVPNLIGLSKTQAQTAWTAAGFTSTLNSWGGSDTALVVTQNQQAFSCLGPSSAMTITRTNT